MAPKHLSQSVYLPPQSTKNNTQEGGSILSLLRFTEEQSLWPRLLRPVEGMLFQLCYKSSHFYRLQSCNTLIKVCSRQDGQLIKAQSRVCTKRLCLQVHVVYEFELLQSIPWSCCAVFVLTQSPDNRQQKQECNDVQSLLGGGQHLSVHNCAVQPLPLCVGVTETFTLSRNPSQGCRFLQ